jgi:hypothetical protein
LEAVALRGTPLVLTDDLADAYKTRLRLPSGEKYEEAYVS